MFATGFEKIAASKKHIRKAIDKAHKYITGAGALTTLGVAAHNISSHQQHEKKAGYRDAIGGAAKGFAKGLHEAGKDTVKGIKETAKNFKGKKAKDIFQTAEGGKTLGHAVGKSVPTIAAGSVLAIGAAKAYKKLRDDTNNSYDQAQNSQYYYR